MSSALDQEIQYHTSQFEEVQTLLLPIIDFPIRGKRDYFDVPEFNRALRAGLEQQKIKLLKAENGYSTSIFCYRLLKSLCDRFCLDLWEDCEHFVHKEPEDRIPKINIENVRQILEAEDKDLDTAITDCVVGLFDHWGHEISSRSNSNSQDLDTISELSRSADRLGDRGNQMESHWASQDLPIAAPQHTQPQRTDTDQLSGNQSSANAPSDAQRCSEWGFISSLKRAAPGDRGQDGALSDTGAVTSTNPDELFGRLYYLSLSDSTPISPFTRSQLHSHRPPGSASGVTEKQMWELGRISAASVHQTARQRELMNLTTLGEFKLCYCGQQPLHERSKCSLLNGQRQTRILKGALRKPNDDGRDREPRTVRFRDMNEYYEY